MTIVLLDSGPLGLVTNPRGSPGALQCKQWLQLLLASGYRVIVPEITSTHICSSR